MSRRDFSRADLRGRLLRAADAPAGEAGAEIDQVLDEVQALGLLSEDRFVHEFVRVRAARFGPMRLRHDLLRRGIDEERIDAALKTHVPDEYSSAHALWLKRFKSAPSDPRERARQSRFLAARGFSHEVIRRVLQER